MKKRGKGINHKYDDWLEYLSKKAPATDKSVGCGWTDDPILKASANAKKYGRRSGGGMLGSIFNPEGILQAYKIGKSAYDLYKGNGIKKRKRKGRGGHFL